MLKQFILLTTFSLLYVQEMPGEPHISWMDTEYTITNNPIIIPVSWDMWWGENGDHWKLLSNNEVIFEEDLDSNSPLAQNASADFTIEFPGNYLISVKLCNGSGDYEICNISSPKEINVIGSGSGPEEINHGEGIENWREKFYSPFVDATGWPPLSLQEFSIQTGVKYFNLGFIVDRTGDACEPSWGGFFNFDGWTEAGDFMFPLIENNEIGNIRQMGGDVMVSIGGAANTPLASACQSVEDLANAYQSIIDEYNLTHLDFDIEGIWVLDDDATDRRSQAIAQVQEFMASENRPLPQPISKKL